MARLQAVMLKQMAENERGKYEDSNPEAAKPGTTALPPLPSVNLETSSGDIIMSWTGWRF